MSTKPNRPNLPERVVEELETQRLRVKSFTVARRMWEDVLTDEDRQRLGGNLEEAWRKWSGTLGIWMELRGVSPSRAIIEVASEMSFLEPSVRDRLLCAIGEPEDDEDRKIDTATSTTSLVLVERPRQAFWRQDPIDIDWDRHAASWSFFWELARKAKQKKAITHFDIGEKCTATALATRKGRLVNHRRFPAKLGILIEAAKGGGYRMELPPQEIRLFEDREGKLTEVFK